MRIVIVEDEAPIREGMGNILQKINPGYKLAGKACDGQEGLALIQEVQPDLVIMDIQMPDMDGLTMLSKLRERGVMCKAIVLTAYSDFNYAKQAIELGIENYLLKPIKIAELKRTLKQVEDSLAREQRGAEMYTLQHIFQSGFGGRLRIDDALKQVVEKRYGFDVDAALELFAVYLGEAYERECEKAAQLLGQAAEDCLIALEERKMIMIVIYRKGLGSRGSNYFARSVVPMLCSNLTPPICMWSQCRGLADLSKELDRMEERLEWNLLFEEGILLSRAEIALICTEPLKYPLELETRVRQAVIKYDNVAFEKCFGEFSELCKSEPHDPKEIKEACVRFCFAVINTAKEYDSLQEELSTQKMVQIISEAVRWETIHNALLRFFEQVKLKSGERGSMPVSATVKRAQAMIREYYNQGITLEEIARRLSVSDEYLSTQFKKETGMSFTETIRSFRIEKIKRLLIDSNLKQNQIADMVGYTDPKYMSKVFKEEVGMLPAEYRKMNK